MPMQLTKMTGIMEDESVSKTRRPLKVAVKGSHEVIGPSERLSTRSPAGESPTFAFALMMGGFRSWSGEKEYCGCFGHYHLLGNPAGGCRHNSIRRSCAICNWEVVSKEYNDLSLFHRSSSLRDTTSFKRSINGIVLCL